MIFCLMGPTASGKTQLAVELVKRYPFEIISVDSAMVYRGMDIGTAKPSADILARAPHRLIDIRDPKHTYSAGEFCQDALGEIKNILASGRIPLLVGGTMMYFQMLQKGMATLPKADPAIRLALKTRAEKIGWENLHAELQQVDPLAASRIQPTDAQRIQRALEVFQLTGQKISRMQLNNTIPLEGYTVHNFTLMPNDRAALHTHIAQRFDVMLAQGFISEVEKLLARGDLTADLPAFSAVGYREAWQHLTGHLSLADMREKTIIATRQLAKRQLTWLRTWPALYPFNLESCDILGQVCTWIDQLK
jgi:tRNA dimethylallyltransferase